MLHFCILVSSVFLLLSPDELNDDFFCSIQVKFTFVMNVCVLFHCRRTNITFYSVVLKSIFLSPASVLFLVLYSHSLLDFYLIHLNHFTHF